MLHPAEGANCIRTSGPRAAPAGRLTTGRFHRLRSRGPARPVGCPTTRPGSRGAGRHSRSPAARTARPGVIGDAQAERVEHLAQHRLAGHEWLREVNSGVIVEDFGGRGSAGTANPPRRHEPGVVAAMCTAPRRHASRCGRRPSGPRPVHSEASPGQRTWVDGVVSAVQSAGAGEACLVGHSFGGRVAFAAAAAHPEESPRLVAVDGNSPTGPARHERCLPQQTTSRHISLPQGAIP